MYLNIPLTFLDKDPAIASRMVATCHLEDMYEDGVRQLRLVVEGNIKDGEYPESNERLTCQLRWLGSERFLYNYVNLLGDRCSKTEHKNFESLYHHHSLDSSDKEPGWFHIGAVFNRHQCELAFVDNIDRLRTRWASSDDIRVQRLRNEAGDASFDNACIRLKPTCDVGRLHRDITLLHDLMNTYDLYTISNVEFLRRNRYMSNLPHYLDFVNIPYIQRVTTQRRMVDFLARRKEEQQV